MPEQTVVVFDTNVIIPLILEASYSTRLFSRLAAAKWHIALSPQLLAEIDEKMRTKQSLRKWLNVSDEEIDDFLKVTLPGKTRWIPGLRQAHGAVPADPKDDIVIAAALEANAEYIISEDKHLLDLGDYQGIKIMDRVQFDAELDRLGVP